MTLAFFVVGSAVGAAHPGAWAYWQANAGPASTSVFGDITSVMDFGIVAGAVLAAGLGGRFRPRSGAMPAPGSVLQPAAS